MLYGAFFVSNHKLIEHSVQSGILIREKRFELARHAFVRIDRNARFNDLIRDFESVQHIVIRVRGSARSVNIVESVFDTERTGFKIRDAKTEQSAIDNVAFFDRRSQFILGIRANMRTQFFVARERFAILESVVKTRRNNRVFKIQINILYISQLDKFVMDESRVKSNR